MRSRAKCVWLAAAVLMAFAAQSSQALAASWAPGVQASLPANASSNPAVSLNSLSCGSAGNCAAIGTYVDTSGQTEGLLLTESGGAWARGVEATLPANAGSNPQVGLSSVSCASAGDCSAVGKYTDSSGRLQGVLLTESGGTWAPGVQAVLPANAISYPAGETYFDLASVSCASPGNCSAVGYYSDASGGQDGLLLTESAGTWAPGVEASLPTNAGYDAFVSSVSCASPGNCSAVGYYSVGPGAQPGPVVQQGLLLTESGGTWAPGIQAPLPANGGNAELSSVSCASASNCSAVGSYIDGSDNPGGLLLTETNGTWAPGVEAASPGNQQSQLGSVSCASAGNCSAVGATGLFNNPEYHGNYSTGLLLNQTGGMWTAGVQVTPTPPNGSPYASLSSVSCASPGNCTAVGSYHNTNAPIGLGGGDSHGLLLSETGGTWAPVAEAALPANAAASPPNASLGSVSCVRGGDYCSAVGSYTDSSGHVQGLLVSTATSLSNLGVSPKKFALAGRRVNGRCVRQTAKNRTHRPCTRPVKLTVGYQLNFPVEATITIKRVASGRLSNHRCSAPTHKNRKHRRCTRLVTVRGSLTETGAQGSNSFGFNGRIGGHKLGPGTYQLTVTPAGGNAQTVMFRIAT